MWKLIFHPFSKASYEIIYNNKGELHNQLKKIGLDDNLIWLLFLRGLIDFNLKGERLILQIIEIIEKNSIF